MAALVLSQHVSLSVLYGLALGLGLASAFSIPSGTSILPQVVAPAQLQQANGILMGIRQLTMLAGPLLAGPLLAGPLFVVAGDGAGGNMADAHGLGFAFAFDCFSFMLSAWTLSKVRTLQQRAPKPAEPVLRAVGAGLAMIWNDIAMRTCFLYWDLCSFVVGGAIQVALPVLASSRLHGAAALGMLGKLRIRNLGTTMLALDALADLRLPLGLVSATWQGVLLLGSLSGFMQIAIPPGSSGACPATCWDGP